MQEVLISTAVNQYKLARVEMIPCCFLISGVICWAVESVEGQHKLSYVPEPKPAVSTPRRCNYMLTLSSSEISGSLHKVCSICTLKCGVCVFKQGLKKTAANYMGEFIV